MDGDSQRTVRLSQRDRASLAHVLLTAAEEAAMSGDSQVCRVCCSHCVHPEALFTHHPIRCIKCEPMPWPSGCSQCQTDTHRCPACGVPTDHAEPICPAHSCDWCLHLGLDHPKGHNDQDRKAAQVR